MPKAPYKKREKKMWGVIIAVFVCIGIALCIILPPGFGNTKAFRDENGFVLEGSISEKVKVDINNTSLGMFIMGKDTSKPILLLLGGGPGIPEYFLETQCTAGRERFKFCVNRKN